MEAILRLVRDEGILDRDAATKSLLLTYLIFIPVMWSPFAFNIQWSDCVFLALVGLFLFQGRLANSSVFPLDYLVLAYAIGSFASLVNGGDVLKQGIESLKMAYLGVVYFVIGALSADQPMRIRLAQWTAWIAASVSFVGVVYLILFALWGVAAEPLGGRMLVPYLNEVLRLQLTLTTPELLGDYLTYGLPFAIALAGFYCDKRSRWLIGCGLLFIAAVEVFTFSHSWVGFTCAGLFFCWSILRGREWRIARHILLVGVLGLFGVMLFASTVYVSDISMRFTQTPAPVGPVPHHVTQSRGDSWPTLTVSVTYDYLAYHVLKVLAWETFLEHPLLGVGLGNFDVVIKEGIARGRIGSSYVTIDSHMTLLGQLAKTGLLGGGALLALWIGSFMLGWRVLRSAQDRDTKWIARACLAGLAGLVINGIYTDIMHFRFLWIDLALLRGISLSCASSASHGSKLGESLS